MRSLTKSQYNVLDLLKLRLSDKEIAYQLKVEYGTVRYHVHSIYKKYGVNNRSALLALFEKEQGFECPHCHGKLTVEIGIAK